MTGIVQVVQTNFTTAFQTAAAGWQAVPGLSVTITPLSVANSIILLAKINLASDSGNGVAYKFQRNGVDIDIGAAAGSRTQATGVSMGTSFAVDSGLAVSEVFVDTPASVAPVTYDVYVNRGNAANVSVNRSSAATDAANFFRTTSNIVVLEFQP